MQKKLAQLSKILGFLTIIIIVVVLVADIIWLAVGGKIGEVDGRANFGGESEGGGEYVYGEIAVISGRGRRGNGGGGRR